MTSLLLQKVKIIKMAPLKKKKKAIYRIENLCYTNTLKLCFQKSMIMEK